MAQRLLVLGDTLFQQGGRNSQPAILLFEVNRVRQEHVAIIRKTGCRRAVNMNRLDGERLLHQPTGKSMTVKQDYFSRIALGDTIFIKWQCLYMRTVTTNFQVWSHAELKQLKTPAVTVQCLAQGFAANNGMTHHRPTAERQPPGAITQRLVLHGDHGADLQVGESFYGNPGVVFL